MILNRLLALKDLDQGNQVSEQILAELISNRLVKKKNLSDSERDIYLPSDSGRKLLSKYKLG